MTTDNRLRISIASARYVEAIECDDQATLTALWGTASRDPKLFAALREIHEGLIEEQEHKALDEATEKLPAIIEQHLTSGEIVRPATGPVTVADVAEELFRRTPDRLPAPAHALNEQLRGLREPLPADLGLSKLLAWAKKFGIVPDAYWKAFREAAIKLELRQAAEVEYQLAARSAKPKPGDRT